MAKSLSLNEIRRRSAQFVVEWRESPGDERQDGQSFIRDLLQVYGITATKAALYEKRAKRSSTGGRGYIDALVPGSSRFVVNDPAVAGIHATVFAALVSRIRIR